MSKHTPGPWILSEYEIRRPITNELRKGCEIFCKDNNLVVCEIPDYHFHAEDVEHQNADARLIAAAPELLEALVAVLSVADRATSEFDIARAAIAKAQGES